jgi:hypothetical protein
MLEIKKTILTKTDVTPENISAEILSSDEPILLKGYGSTWPIVQASQKSITDAVKYLQKLDNSSLVNVCYLEPDQSGRIFYNEDMTTFNFETRTQTLSSVLFELLALATVEKPTAIYVGSTCVQQVLPKLIEETITPPLLHNTIYNLWLGNKTKVAAHFDFLQNLACCVVGKRRFILFPPEQIKNLYCGPLDKAPGGQCISMVDFDNPNLKQFPNFQQAVDSALSVVLEPGDAILLPSMWWHYVEGLDDINMLLNHWWRNSPSYMGNPTDALHHAIMSIRDLPQPQRQAWQQLFNYYVFEYEPENFMHIKANAMGMLASPMDEIQARKIRANLQNKLRR